MMTKALTGIKTQAESNKNFCAPFWATQSNTLHKINLDWTDTFRK